MTDKKQCDSNIDIPLEQLRETQRRLMGHHLLPYLHRLLSYNSIASAVANFYPGELAHPVNTRLFSNELFIPWLLFDWVPGVDTQIKLAISDFDVQKTVAHNYQATHPLSTAEQAFIEAMQLTYFSFYRVLSVSNGSTLLVKDIIFDAIYTVQEKAATHFLAQDALFFARLLPLNGRCILMGMAPYRIPESEQTTIMAIRQSLMVSNPAQAGGQAKHTLLQPFFQLASASGVVQTSLQINS